MKVISLGTANLSHRYGISNNSKLHESEVIQILEESVGKIEFLDCAPEYQSGYSLLRKYSRHFKITTKISTKSIKFLENVPNFLEKECINLGVDSIHTLLLRGLEMDDSQEITRLWLQAVKAKELGLVRRIGLSIYEPNEMLKLCKNLENIDIFHVPASIVDRRFAKSIIRHNLQTRYQYSIRSIFLQGLLTMNEKDIPYNLRGILPLRHAIEIKAKELDISYISLVIGYSSSLNWCEQIVIGVNSRKQLVEILEGFKLQSKIDYSFLDSFEKCEDFILDPRKWS